MIFNIFVKMFCLSWMCCFLSLDAKSSTTPLRAALPSPPPPQKNTTHTHKKTQQPVDILCLFSWQAKLGFPFSSYLNVLFRFFGLVVLFIPQMIPLVTWDDICRESLSISFKVKKQTVESTYLGEVWKWYCFVCI